MDVNDNISHQQKDDFNTQPQNSSLTDQESSFYSPWDQPQQPVSISMHSSSKNFYDENNEPVSTYYLICHLSKVHRSCNFCRHVSEKRTKTELSSLIISFLTHIKMRLYVISKKNFIDNFKSLTNE